MKSTDVPALFPIPFASAASPAYIQQVPTAYNSAIPGSFGLDVGSPPETFLDPAAGGIAPLGEYFNGLMNQVTAWIRWQQSGGMPGYNAAQCTAIGGYPLGAVLKAASYGAFWLNTADNNTANPDSGTLTAPALGWTVLQPGTYPWGQVTGAPAFTLESEFTGANQSMGSGGYQKLPGGLILQWGSYTAAASDIAYTVSLPIAFPHTHFQSYASVKHQGAVSGSWSAYATPGSLSTVILTGDVSSGSATNIPISFFCLGN